MTMPHPAPQEPAAGRRDALHVAIAVASFMAIALYLIARFLLHVPMASAQPILLAVLVLGGLPLIAGVLNALRRGDVGADLLAVISIIAAALLGEYLAGTIVVLMLSGGAALEDYALRNASSVLRALAKRMPAAAHRKVGEDITDVPLPEIAVGDVLVVFPHETCPVDGVVVEGHGGMDESYLTGEPFRLSKAPGAAVLSGAINGESALIIRATRLAVDSRYAKIMEVMRTAAHNRPRLQRLGDRLAAYYIPCTLVVAVAAWLLSGEAARFLAVLVVARPARSSLGSPWR